MNPDLYLDHQTFFHRLDPRTKLVMLLVTFVVILYFENPFWILPIWLLVVLALIVSRSLVNVWRIRYIMIVLAISGLIIWNLFARGTTHLFWIFSLESLAFSLSRVLIILTAIMAGMFFVSTTRVEEFVLGAIRLGLPYRVGFAISIAIRLVPLIISNVFAIAEAQRSRGLDLDSGNVLQRLRKYIPLLVPVFISTIRTINTLAMALEARGFGAYPTRTYYLELKLRPVDGVMIGLSLVILAVMTYFKLQGYGTIPGLIR